MKRLVLVIHIAGAPALERRFDDLPVTLGRHVDNDVQLEGRFVSSFHARLEAASGRLSLIDLNSTNGTHVPAADGQAPRRLMSRTVHVFEADPAEFWIGHYRIEARLEAEVQARAPACEVGSLAFSSLSLPPIPGVPAPLVEVIEAAPAAPASPPECPDTRSLALPPELVALEGLRELVASLAPGLTLDTPGDVARLITRLHAVLEIFCRCLVDIRAAQRRQLARFEAPGAPGEAPLDAARRPRDMAALLLDFRRGQSQEPLDLEAALRRLLAHEVAVLDGMVEGVSALLSDLDPALIEAEVRTEAPAWTLGFGAHAKRWEQYRRRHAALSERGALSRVFSAAFSRAYAAYTHQRRSEVDR